MKSKKRAQDKPSEKPLPKGLVCIICGKPATRMVDEDPSCDEHVELVYEDQVESYTLRHLADQDWIGKT